MSGWSGASGVSGVSGVPGVSGMSGESGVPGSALRLPRVQVPEPPGRFKTERVEHLRVGSVFGLKFENHSIREYGSKSRGSGVRV